MSKLACCIVETRAEPNLLKVMANHLERLPEGTDLVWFTSHETYKERGDEVRMSFSNGRKVHIHLRTVNTVGDYNRLLTSPEFWAILCDWEKVMVFQTDGSMLRSGIEEFYDVDYIGAEWAFNRLHPGNGGESLRTPQVMLQICQTFAWDGVTNEDIWITERMFNYKIGKLATIEQARRFSVEAVFTLGSMCQHAASKWLSPAECEQIRNQYK